MDDELVDVLDADGNITGETKLKVECHNDGTWHRASHIWIYNSKGELLLQKRAKQKMLFPGLWDVSAAGHVSAGQSYDEAAIRELFEELGVKTDISSLKKVELRRLDIKSGSIYNREFVQVYLLKLDKKVKELTLQKEEIERAKFMPLDKFESGIKDSSKTKKYAPHGDYYFDVIRYIREELAKIGSKQASTS
jgi:isopentenyl-diphosphate delta-isomerase